MPDFTHSFFTALSFLSRLASPRIVPDEIMARSVIWYPLIGALLGALALFPALLWAFFAPFFFESWVWPAAWTYVLFVIWLSRALHWDGWADLADALGSGLHGESFRAVLKDSRVGVFGVLALVLGVSGEIFFAANCLEQRFFGIFVWAPLFGRSLILPLARCAPPYPGKGLSGFLGAGTTWPFVLCTAIVAVAAGIWLVGPLRCAVSLGVGCIGLLALQRVARREGGVSGDFYGAIVIWGELSALSVAALLHF